MADYFEAGGDIETTNRMEHTPFILSTYYGHTEAAAGLLQLGANPCAVDRMGSHAMMGVVFKGHLDTFEWILESTDCDVNHQNHAGQTALMLAALFDRKQFVEMLLDRGADPTIRDYQGNSAASLATGQGAIELAEMLSNY